MAAELLGRVAYRFIGISVGLGMGGLLIYKNAAEVFPHETCKRITALKTDEEPSRFVEVPERCKTQFDEVAKKFGLENTDKISLFLNRGAYPISSGSPSFPNGAVMGLPKWFLFENDKDIEKAGITFQGRDIKWDSELGVMIKECLLPTDDMIAFAIGHELSRIQRLDYLAINSVLAPTWLYLTFRVVNATPRLLKLNTLFDVILKLLLCRMSYLCYKLTNAHLYHKVCYDADDVSAKCEPRMLQGGVDLLSRRIQLNLIVRRLLGREGKEFYTKEGNEVESSLYPLLTERLGKLKALQGKSSGVTHEVISTSKKCRHVGIVLEKDPDYKRHSFSPSLLHKKRFRDLSKMVDSMSSSTYPLSFSCSTDHL